MSWEKMIPFVGTIVSLLAAFLTFLLKSIKNGKAKKFLQQTLKITEILQQLIVVAEKFTNYTGAEKKEFVLTKIEQFSIENNMKFDSEQISQMIDTLVDTTKKVNMRTKDQLIAASKLTVAEAVNGEKVPHKAVL